MHPAEIDAILATMQIIVDTREQATPQAVKRWKSFECKYTREKLDFGDYSAKFTLDSGKEISLKNVCSIERKMSLDELANCFTKERDRFRAEFERARAARAKLYLLVENGSIDDIFAWRYRSRFHPNAFSASLFAWGARYNSTVLFCRPSITSRVIPEILKREAKEYFEKALDI